MPMILCAQVVDYVSVEGCLLDLLMVVDVVDILLVDAFHDKVKAVSEGGSCYFALKLKPLYPFVAIYVSYFSGIGQ